MSSLISRAVTAATTPTKTGWSVAAIVKDITVYGGTAVSVLEVIENVGGVSAPVQSAIGAAVAILTALLSVLRQQQVATAKAAVAVKAAKKAAK